MEEKQERQFLSVILMKIVGLISMVGICVLASLYFLNKGFLLIALISIVFGFFFLWLLYNFFIPGK